MSKDDWGFDKWFENYSKDICKPKQVVARVSAVDRGRYSIVDENGEKFAWLTGKFKHSVKDQSDYPVIGDWVCVKHKKSGEPSKIHACLPRKTTLKRKSAGRQVEYQYIASNVDKVFILVSCFFDFNVRRLERYLSIVKESKIQPVIVLTKIDLIDDGDLSLFIEGIRSAGIHSDIIPISNERGLGLECLKAHLECGKTYCLIGSSGVGKSTLINHLLPDNHEPLKTGEVMNSGEGRHTTVRRRLLRTGNGALIIDTPGMREMGLMSNKGGIDESFSDIVEIAKKCHFKDCKHQNEPKCAVIQAVREGVICDDHYRSYLLLQQEAKLNQQSYIAKRRRPLSTLKPDPVSAKHKGIDC